MAAKKDFRKRKKESVRQAAEEQIRELFRQAALAGPALAKRYVEIALKISMKTKTPVPRELKRMYCKNCRAYLVPHRNCRIRLSRGKIVYYCLNCKHIRRFGYR